MMPTQVYDYTENDSNKENVKTSDTYKFSYAKAASAAVAGYMVTVYMNSKNGLNNPKLIIEGIDYMPEIIENTKYVNNEYKPKNEKHNDFCQRLTLKELEAYVTGEKPLTNSRQQLCLAFAYGVITNIKQSMYEVRS